MEFRSGLTPAYKTFSLLFIVLPKIGLAIALLVYGTGYVMASEETADLLLNSLALIFIVEIAEILYAFLIPGPLMDVLADLPPVRQVSLSRQAEEALKGRFTFCANIKL